MCCEQALTLCAFKRKLKVTHRRTTQCHNTTISSNYNDLYGGPQAPTFVLRPGTPHQHHNTFLVLWHRTTFRNVVWCSCGVGTVCLISVADPGFLQGGCGSWCLWSAPSPFMPSLPPTLKKISWELAARQKLVIIIIVLSAVLTVFEIGRLWIFLKDAKGVRPHPP